MIKLVYVIRRRQGLSAEDFATYWRDTHGPLVEKQASAIAARRYVQSHPIDHPANEAMRAVRGMLPPADGVTEVWWDSLEAMQAAYATPEGAEAGQILRADEERFIDFSGSSVFLTEEHEIFDRTGGKGPGPEAVKVTYLLARRPEMSVAQCHATWLKDHGPLVKSHAERLLMARYVQSHAIAPDVNEGFRQAGGYIQPFEGITEVWVRSLADLEASGQTAEQQAAAMELVEDERRFVDMGRSHCFLTREHLVFDHVK